VRDAMDMDALVTAKQASDWIEVVSIPLILMWRRAGHLAVRGQSGRSPLYRLGDVYDVERRMAKRAWQANNHRARRVA
jgi:hypothetical protein